MIIKGQNTGVPMYFYMYSYSGHYVRSLRVLESLFLSPCCCTQVSYCDTPHEKDEEHRQGDCSHTLSPISVECTTRSKLE